MNGRFFATVRGNPYVNVHAPGGRDSGSNGQIPNGAAISIRAEEPYSLVTRLVSNMIFQAIRR